MKLLWLTNKVIPAVEEAAYGRSQNTGGGWLDNTFSQLCGNDDVQMHIVCCGGSEQNTGKVSAFAWTIIKGSLAIENRYSSTLCNSFKAIIKDFQPDLIHVWGTEFPHTLSLVNAALDSHLLDRTVVSIQGLISFISKHYTLGIPEKFLKKNTFSDFFLSSSVLDQQASFYKRGLYEIDALSKVKHVIGRTFWDQSCVALINPSVNYFKCNETLRDDFYTGRWDYNKCQKHSIFISQAGYPVKGFHLFLKALPHIIKKHPDTQVYVAGSDPTKITSLKSKLLLSGYGLYLRKLIHTLHVEDRIHFLGNLKSSQMKEQYLKCNVFISCSTIENSPNSVGEAMLLGCPVISSDVGGVRSLLINDKDGLTYAVDEYYIIPELVNRIFKDPLLASELGKNAQKHASVTHDPQKNYSDLLAIYNKLVVGT
jgi:glycosyltransferase involved in cell wall biosynthesis